MAEITNIFDPIKGILVKAGKNGANLRDKPGTTTGSKIIRYISPGVSIGNTTGRLAWVKSENTFWVEISSQNHGVVWASYKVLSYPSGFNSSDLPRIATQAFNRDNDKSEAQKAMDRLILSDRALFLRLLAINRQIDEMKAKGIDTSQFEQKARQISEQYNERQRWIRQNTTNATQFKKSLFSAFVKYITDGPSGLINGLGAVPVVVLVIAVVAAVVVTGVTIYMIQPKYDESKSNLKITAELEQALSKVDPKTREKIIKDLEGQIDNAYNAGKRNQFWSSLGTTGKVLLIGGVSILGYSLIKKT